MIKARFAFGKIDGYHNSKKSCPVFIDVELRNEQDKPEFSACGYVYNHLKTDCIIGGLCLDTLNEFHSIKNNPMFRKIYRLWKLYHLNGMHAGTPEQEQAINAWKDAGNRYDYRKVCDYLKSIGLYEVEHEGKPYKYGHSWLYQPIPDDDLNEIRCLIGGANA